MQVAELLCIGGPLDGQMHRASEETGFWCFFADPQLSVLYVLDYFQTGLVSYYRPDTMTQDEAMRKLIQHYRP